MRSDTVRVAVEERLMIWSGEQLGRQIGMSSQEEFVAALAHVGISSPGSALPKWVKRVSAGGPHSARHESRHSRSTGAQR